MELLAPMKKKKYPNELIKAGIEKVWTFNRDALLAETNNENNDKVIPSVSTFNPRNPEVYLKLQHDLSVLKRDTHMPIILKDKKTIHSFIATGD